MIELPTLYSKDAKGKIIQWRVYNDGDVVVTEHGQLGGKQAINRDRALPTNVGRSNERLGEAQAEFEAEAAWTKKKKQGYFETIDEAKTTQVILPMLAHPLEKKSRNSKGIMVVKRREIEFPCHVQRKLNGLRCLAIVGQDGTVALKSRQGTLWTYLEHIEAEVAAFAQPGDILDGEIYLHGTPLQTINGWIKNGSDPHTAIPRSTLQYHIYDLPSHGGSWQERWTELLWRFSQVTLGPFQKSDTATVIGKGGIQHGRLHLIETHVARDEADVKDFAAKAVAGGYEGVIIRHLHHPYTFGKRKDALIKWKEFIDEEFLVENITSREYFDADGKSFPILDKCVCRNNQTEATFEVVPLGTIPEKQKMWEQRDQYIGQRLVVRFLERSIDGIPQGNPVGLGFRHEADMPLEENDMAMWE